MSAQLIGERPRVGKSSYRVAETEELATKTCPQCGQMLFQDMSVCYGCLYDFSREGTRRVPLLPDPVLDGGMEVVESEDLEEEPTLVADDGASVFGGITRVAHEPKQGLALFIQTGDVDLTVPVPSQGLMVGRLATNDIVLHSRAVSKRHVFVIPCGWTLLVQDQGATNPAILKGQEVTGGQTMCLGDTLNICGSLLTLVEGKAAVSDAT